MKTPGWGVSLAEDTFTPKLLKALKQLKPILLKRINEAGRNMVNYAKSIVPVRTGYLKSTIQFVYAGDLTWWFGATAPYALFVEFGTRYMSPRPFIRPALELYVPETVKIVKGEVLSLFR